ncbi:MAG: hypothetical protein Q9213_002336 [Squamulea squamosa]
MTSRSSNNLTRPAIYAPSDIAVNISHFIDDHPADDDHGSQAYQAMDGNRFSSAIFQISTGAGQIEYAVHETCLRKSPVFARMCTPGFKEAHEKRITLPEESPSVLAAIVEYLYTDNFWANGHPHTNPSTQNKAWKLAHLYVSAGQYGLEAMKDIIVTKLEQNTVDWFQVADIIYESHPSDEEPYPKYFRSLVVSHLNSDQKIVDAVTEDLEDRIKAGGPMAVDIHRAYKMFWAAMMEKEKETSTALFSRLQEDCIYD